MIFSISKIEKQGRDSFFAGLPRNKNPYIGKLTWIGKLKEKLWYCAFDNAERYSRGA
jgi:hypothetical protein